MSESVFVLNNMMSIESAELHRYILITVQRMHMSKNLENSARKNFASLRLSLSLSLSHKIQILVDLRFREVVEE